MKVRELFQKHDKEFGHFERIEDSPCKRPDLYAMTILDRLCPGEGDLIVRTDFDSFTFSISVDQLEGVATEEDIITLIRCGVTFYSCGDNALFMFT
jgi:hypothetical protein